MGFFSFLTSHKLLSVAVGLGILLVGALVFLRVNKVSPVAWGWFGTINESNGVALGGHDAVSYHEDGQPLMGSGDLSWSWRGVEWRFATEANRTRFQSDPDQFAPQFGGFCSFAVSKGFTAKVNPREWHIEDGKLYVFADARVKAKWVSGISDGVLSVSENSWARRP